MFFPLFSMNQGAGQGGELGNKFYSSGFYGKRCHLRRQAFIFSLERYINLGHPEADPETKLQVQVVYWG